MAKKKKRKNSDEGKVKFSAELTGLILVLISIIGIGNFGPVGHVIKSFAIFLMGNWWAIFIILLLILGLFMIMKRDTPKFFSSRLIGIYILLIALLAFSHIDYINDAELIKAKDIFQHTIDNFMDTINDSAYVNLSQNGGGIIGALFSFAFVNLFDLKGTYIVLGVLGAFGAIMALDLSFGDIFKKIGSLFKKIGTGVSEAKVFKYSDDEDEEDNSPVTYKEEPKEDKVIITSSEDLKNFHSEEIQTNKDVKQEEVITIENSSGGDYKLPSLDILNPLKKSSKGNGTEFLNQNRIALEKVLNDFQITGKVVAIHEGPAVTQFEVEIKAGTKVSRITSINKEIALALAAKDVRIEAPIPGKSTVGIEIPNKNIAAVPIREVFSSIPKNMSDAKILVALGKDLMGRTCCADIAKMPHLLVAGSTGSGKSVCINSFIASILMFMKPDEIKLVLVDPKKVELSNYNGVPHLLCPVVTDPKKANVALQKIVIEMERRYELFSEAGAKNIKTYNEMIEKKNKANDVNVPKLPYIVVIIDELADLMLVAGKEVEDYICRLAQMGRASGIHLVIATQRPTTDVITGLIKANIPSRIALSVKSQIDSRTIIDMAGADKLLGNGDMLYYPIGASKPVRVQGCFASSKDIEKTVEFVKSQLSEEYDNSIIQAVDEFVPAVKEKDSFDSSQGNATDEDIVEQAIAVAVENGQLSTSMLQRKLKLGYARAARIMDELEEMGVIGASEGAKPRKVLMSKLQFDERRARKL